MGSVGNADSKVPPREKEPTSHSGNHERKRHSVVRRWSQPEQREWKADRTGSPEPSIHGPVHSACVGQVSEAQILQERGLHRGHGPCQHEQAHLPQE